MASDYIINSSTLSAIISTCFNSLNIFKKIKNGEISLTPESGKEKIQEIVIQFLTTKINCLFDKDPRSNSLETIISFANETELNNVEKADYTKELESIKTQHQTLIKRIKNNRNKGIAHTSAEDVLGFDEETTKRVNEYYKIIGVDFENEYKPVDPEFEFLTPNNFPTDEAEQLLNKLKNIIFYQLWYPKVVNKSH